MTPADLRAIAARVMAGEATNEEIAPAFGWTRGPYGDWWQPHGADPNDYWRRIPNFLHGLDAADLLMAPLRKRGWFASVAHVQSADGTQAFLARASSFQYRLLLTARSEAPTEPRARTALALLCRAAEGEATP